jgi:hypothetical protein
MKEVALSRIEIDGKGWLRLYPVDASYDYIYRSAADVHWDKEGKFLHSEEPREWSYFQCFEHIVASVASEYGDQLKITEKTQWHNVPDLTRLDIGKAKKN